MSCREHAFIKNHKEYFGISKRYIEYSEIVEIAERYNLDESVINYEINKENELFIKSQILVYLNEFKSFLFSRKLPIEDNAIIQLQSKYNKKYFNYYRELHFDKLIEIWRFLIKESIENGDLIEYQNLLFLDYIDENNHLFLKNKGCPPKLIFEFCAKKF